MLKQVLLLELMKRGKSLSEASKEIGIDISEGVKLLKNSKIETKRIIYHDGTIDTILKNYDKSSSIDDGSEEDNHAIYTLNNGTLRTCAIADLHYTHTMNSSVNYMNYAYDLLAKESIKHNFVIGDICDGMFGSSNFHLEPSDQVDHFLRTYPYDKNIRNWYILGDHDLSLLTREKVRLHENVDIEYLKRKYHYGESSKDRIYLEDEIKKNRDDFTCLGILKGTLRVQNDFIKLLHLPRASRSGIGPNTRFVLRAHSHSYELRKQGNITEFFMYPFSDVLFTDKSEVSLYLMDYNFSNGLVKNVVITPYIISVTTNGGKLVPQPKYTINLSQNRKLITKDINFLDKRLVK